MAQTTKTSPRRARSSGKPHRVVTLVYHGLAAFEFGVAVEFFALERWELSEWYDFGLASVDEGPVRVVGGFRIQGAAGLGALRKADTIVVPGWRGVETPVPEGLIRALRRAHQRGARLVSFCSGAFVLAATGLLDGRRLTTHWRYADAMKARYPKILVDPDVLYVDEGTILTSAGSAAAIDLCLHLVRKDWGPKIANTVARRLVVPPHRDGGQSQFIEKTMPEADEPAHTRGTVDYIRAHLHEELSVPELARRAKMSERSFARHFRAEMGVSPARFVTSERVLKAQELLERTDLPIEEVAARVGFGSAMTLRQHFARAVRISPTAYRRRFRRRVGAG